MGCSGSAEKHDTVPIQNSMITLLVSGQNDLLMRKIKLEGNNIDYNAKLNFKGDTILHYAAMKDNTQVIKHVINQPNVNPHPLNDEGLRPVDMTKNQQTKQIFLSKSPIKQQQKHLSPAKRETMKPDRLQQETKSPNRNGQSSMEESAKKSQ